jgi:hypothetical protein
MMMLLLVGLGGSVLLGPLLWWYRELFFRLRHGGSQCWRVRRIEEDPQTQRHENNEAKRETRERWGDKESPKAVLASKVLNPFTRALAPPFIGRRRDFYIPKIPSNLRNIPSLNMYMNVFYIP